MRIDIFSDFTCPWCFIGKRRLERALAARPQLAARAELCWRSFLLNPDMPPEGMDRAVYLQHKFGSSSRSEQVYRNVARAGLAEGITFNFDVIKRTPDSMKAQRLLRFAAKRGLEAPLAEVLFSAYFLQGQDIGDSDTLTRLARSSGLPQKESQVFLESDAEAEAVRKEDREARRAGINAIPCFIVEGRDALPGAQPPESLLQLFDLALTAAPDA